MRRFKPQVVAAFVIGIAAGVVGGCQVYDFEPVVPLTFTQYSDQDVRFGRALKPNLMLLVDKSGSMDLPADTSDPDCRIADGGTCGAAKNNLCNTATCPTRWSELQGAMEDFLSTRGDVARMGLAVYPTNLQCGNPDAGTKVLVALNQNPDDDVASLRETAEQINLAIQGISSSGAAGTDLATGGGTPTGSSVTTLSALPELNDPEREDLVLVLTDGLPNCNPEHPTPIPDPNCRCTGVCLAQPHSTAWLGCLDKDGSVGAIAGARSKQIRTAVVGFGAELASGTGPEVLNAMAVAGGFSRSCAADGGSPGCPAGETCRADGTCPVTQFYSASNRADLAAALAAITDTIGDPCEYIIEQNPENNDERLVVVYVTEFGKDPVRLTAGPDTFTYQPGLVTLVGQTCSLVSNATPQNPVTLQIRVLASL